MWNKLDRKSKNICHRLLQGCGNIYKRLVMKLKKLLNKWWLFFILSFKYYFNCFRKFPFYFKIIPGQIEYFQSFQTFWRLCTRTSKFQFRERSNLGTYPLLCSLLHVIFVLYKWPIKSNGNLRSKAALEWPSGMKP